MSFSALLLSTFAKNTRFGSDIESIRLRFQALSVIYIDLSVCVVLIIFDFLTWATVRLPSAFNSSLCFYLCMSIALPLLRQNKINLACIMSIIALLATNYVGSNFGGEPVIGFTGLLACSVLNFFLAYSVAVYIVTTALSIAMLGWYVQKIHTIFQITISDEQSKQVIILLVTMCVLFITISAAFTLQKSIEINIWKIAHTNYMRSEILTREVLQASRAKDVFVSSLSHEIRNPLNSIKGSIDYLLEVIASPEQSKMLQNAKLGCEILLNLANNALDAAKLQADKMELSYSTASFRTVVEKAFMINSETLRSKNIHLKAFIDRNLPETMRIDPSRMLQIMMNLLSNALKFTPAGGRITVHVAWCPSDMNIESLIKPGDNAALTVPVGGVANYQGLRPTRLDSTYEFSSQECLTRRNDLSFAREFKIKSFSRADPTSSEHEPWNMDVYSPRVRSSQSSRSKGYLKVQVTDTGNGIAAEHIPKLFQMFTQAHRSVVTMHGGTGLGLWICKQLCQKMGGDIKLYSELGRGTTFVFYVAVNSDERHELTTTRPDTLQIRPNVLIVDDYAHNRELHKLLVEKEGAQAILASDGIEAVEKFKAHEEGFFSFIMMDVKMVEMDGFAAARLIREWEREQRREKKVDIYFVSGEYFDEEDVIRAFKAAGGTSDIAGIRCLRKPIDLEVVKTTVLSYIR